MPQGVRAALEKGVMMDKDYVVELLTPVRRERLASAVLRVADEMNISIVKLTKLLEKGPGTLTRPTTRRTADQLAAVLRAAGVDVLVRQVDLFRLLPQRKGMTAVAAIAPEPLKLKDTLEMDDPPLSVGPSRPRLDLGSAPPPPVSRKAPPMRAANATTSSGHRSSLLSVLRTIFVLIVVASISLLPAETGRLLDFMGRQPAQPFEAAMSAYARGAYGRALELWRPLAESGNPEAQFLIGEMYRRGLGVAPDGAQAASWLRLAADQGHGQARFQLGILYFDGTEVTRDYGEAASWFRLAADQGLAAAQFNLAVMLFDGLGMPQDADEALDWLRRSASGGVAQAQDLLDTLGVLQDLPNLPEVSSGTAVAAAPKPEWDIFQLARGGSSADLAQAVQAGVDINAQDTYGQTPLMYAAGVNTPEVLREILNRGASVNTQSASGWTALMYAVRDNPDPRVLEMLLLGGADPQLENSDGDSALDIAKRYRPELLGFLQSGHR